MIDFTNQIATNVVKEALKSVADFDYTADITTFNFSRFNEFHKKTFIISLKKEVLNIKEDNYYFDIPLTPEEINNWTSISDCINYTTKYATRYPSQTKKVEL